MPYTFFRLTAGTVSLAWTLSVALASPASSTSHRITATSVGPVKLGMTLAQARKLLPGLTLGKPGYSDHKGGITEVLRGKKHAMWLLAAQHDTGEPPKETGRIGQIWVSDPAYATAEGVKPGTLVTAAVKHYGPVKLVESSQENGFEVMTFTRQPAGLFFAVKAPKGEAGKYSTPAGEYRKTQQYVPGAFIEFMGVGYRRQPSDG